MARRFKIFEFAYGSFYLFLYIILLGLILITPGDIIDRSVHNRQNFNIWILTVAYVVTTLVVVVVYVLRLYINKTALASIPKGWVPIEKGDVKQSVYKMIEKGLSRSAAIAYAARPRVDKGVPSREHTQYGERGEGGGGGGGGEGGERKESQIGRGHERQILLRRPETADDVTVSIPDHRPVWGIIEHYGWSSPNSTDLPNLQYNTVLSEVPNLIEAKALTLAPPDPTWQAEPPMMDPEAVSLLQRLPYMSLRDYLERLAELGVVAMNNTASDFMSQYEYARFSTRPISNAQFREIMHLFAEILRAMQPLDSSLVDHGSNPDDESDVERSRQRSYSPRPSTSSTQSSLRRPLRARSSYRTAPDTPGGKRTMEIDRMSQRSGSTKSSARTKRRPHPRNQPSSASLRSGRSDGSGSLIRLATWEDDSDLPYVLSLRDSAGSAY